MFRLKTLGVLAGMIAVLAISASPASAWWEATGKQWKGPVRVIASGAFVDGEGTGAARVECPPAGVEATWSIQTKGQIKIHEKEGKQEQTKVGPHLHIKVLKWGSECKATVGSSEFKKVTVSPCELQLVQERGSFVANGGVVTECVVKVNEESGATFCEIRVPAGLETSPQSNKGHNVGLAEIKLENIGLNNQLDKTNVTGVQTLRGAGSKTLCPIANNETSKLEGLEFEVEGAKAI
jgi:hypothetical protein